MINSIEGRLTGLTLTHAYINTDSGIEFSILVSSQTSSAIMGYLAKSESVKLYTLLIHREDAMYLIGFKDITERKLFEELNSISGIGVKQALKILSGMSTREFIEALDKGDVKKISSIPGLGVKTAQKILIMLREKLVEIERNDKPKSSLSALLMPFSDIIDAMCDMGYQKEDVKKALEGILNDNADKFAPLSHEEKEKQVFTALLKELYNG
ncbi:MAG: Holliday junction branch migration protein RuvA [Sphaerochaetaceae bacterium]|nr:Holliday junction branch migration protein RuvA [Sphaerochaetaceae bacterium]